jgi:4-aminobutyrate aminotransferase
MPNDKLDNIFYVNSGSEATDNSIKIARKYTHKPNIIAMNKGFHGRSIAALSITSSNIGCRKGLTPLLSNVFFCPDFTKSSLENIFEHQSSPSDTAGIILEPVQGEGGIYSIDSEFLKYVEGICQEHNILLIADEVQCGAMRTGTWWNFEQKEITPDIMTFGKGIASGYPLAGVIANSKIMNSLGDGYLGGTYGGNAIASAAASATIDILNNDDIQKNVIEMGKYIKDNLQNEPNIKEIRQYGLMIGIEFTFSNQNPYYTKEIVEQLAEEGVLVLLAGNKNQYIRLLPPLNISKEEIDLFLFKFKSVCLF